MVEKRENLINRVHQAITSVYVLSSHDIQIDYLLKILFELYRELTSGDKTDFLHNIPKKVIESGGKNLDAISLYSRDCLGKESNVLESFLNSLANSPLSVNLDFSKNEEDSEELLETPLEKQLRENELFPFLVQHAQYLEANNIHQLMGEYLGLLQETGVHSEELLPRILTINIPQKKSELPTPAGPAFYWKLSNELRKRNVFNLSRVLEYNVMSNTFSIGECHELKSPEKFFGYREIKKELNEYFQKFASGLPRRPLLLMGPPGVGKTQLTHSFSQSIEGVHLVKSSPETLNHLDEAFSNLVHYQSKIILFIDDIETKSINWQVFRSIFESGGAKPPSNICLVISSNYNFPDNVKSRSLPIYFADISNPNQGYETVVGIIKDYFDQRKIGADKLGKIDLNYLNLLAKFTAQDFYHGAAPLNLRPYWDSDNETPRQIRDFANFIKEMHSEIPESVLEFIKPYNISQEKGVHEFELSPRGLIQYLDKMPNYLKIKERMNKYNEINSPNSSLAEDAEAFIAELSVEEE